MPEFAQRQINHTERSPATVRALARVQAGDKPTHAAKAEGINSSTLWRALAKERPKRLFLIVSRENGGWNAWIENQNYKQIGKDYQFASVNELQAAIPALMARTTAPENSRRAIRLPG